MSLRSPLLHKLQQIARRADELFPALFRGFDNIGLIVGTGAPNHDLDYWCSPLNVKWFAATGGGGVHFGFNCEEDDDSWDELPVIVSNPGAIDRPNLVVGEDLFEFLCFGCYGGYFALEQLGFQLKKTLEVYASPDWKATTHKERWVGFEVNELQATILEFLRTELRLTSLCDLESRFDSLQEKHLPRLRLPSVTQ